MLFMRMYNEEKHAFIYIALEIIVIIPYLCVPHNMLLLFAALTPFRFLGSIFFFPLVLPLAITAYHPL